MASTVTLSGDWLQSLGSRRATSGTLNLGNPYAADGIAVSATQVGLGVIEDLRIQPAGGYVFEYVKSSGKVKAYLAGARTHTHDLFLNDADQVDAAGTRVNAATDKLGANSGADITVTGVTNKTGHGGVLQTTLAAAALAEAGAIDLSLVEARFVAFGY